MLVSFLRKLGSNRYYIGLTGIVIILTVSQWTMRAIQYKKAHRKEIMSEQFDFKLESLNSMEKLSSYIDSVSMQSGIGIEQPERYVSMIDNIIRQRFFHGESRLSFSKNFIAWMAGKVFWADLSVGVTPNEILKHPNALCSQSAIVFQEIVKQKGFTVRAIGLNRHFCSEVFYRGSWHFVDSDKEPIFDEIRPIPSVEELSQDDKMIEKAYIRDSDNVTLAELKDIFNSREILFYQENQFPAENMRLFQAGTKFLSNYLWLFMITPIILAALKKRVSTKKTKLVSEPVLTQNYAEKESTHTLL